MQTTSSFAPALLLSILAVAGPAVALDEEPLRPEEAYRYVVTDTGDAFEVDWAIEDGYYLYRNKLGFEIDAKGARLGEARLPEGLPHEDEFFGKQQVYREHFYVRVPYRIDGDRPETMDLVIKSQGCWDGGLCYPPQSWTEKVQLRRTDKAKLDLADVGKPANAMGDFPPPEEVFFPNLFPVDGNTVELGFRIIPGYYLYKDKISVRSLSDNAMAGQLELPQGKIKVDEFFGESEVYYDEVIGRLTIARATPDAMDLELEVNYQGCADGGLCYLPQTTVMSVSLPEATAITDLSTLPRRCRSACRTESMAIVLKRWILSSRARVAGMAACVTRRSRGRKRFSSDERTKRNSISPTSANRLTRWATFRRRRRSFFRTCSLSTAIRSSSVFGLSPVITFTKTRSRYAR